MVEVIDSPDSILEDEWYIVRYSGEIPEIAYNSAIYHLTRAKNGPKLSLSNDQIQWLKDAAMARYGEIVTRDLIHENHTKTIYRGLKRSIHNYERFCRFCSRQDLDVSEIKTEAARLLPLLLLKEIARVKTTGEDSVINCSYAELQLFAKDLNVLLTGQLNDIQSLCPG